MVEPRDDNGKDFIINENYTEEETEDLHRGDYFGNASGIFSKKNLMPFVIGGLGIVVLVFLFVLLLSGRKNAVDQEYLQSLETRMQQMEKKLATIGVMDQNLERLGKHEHELDLLDKKINRLESTLTTQIDQIIKELGGLHRKIAQRTASGASTPKTVKKKQPVTLKKTESIAGFHQVKEGETLYSISRRYGLSVEQLQSYNKLSPNAAIYPGQKLKLDPNAKE